jgi:low affinity Fe/Cu permease
MPGVNLFSEVENLSESEAAMSMQRIFGIVLLLVGIVVLIVGMNASHSAADQISHSFTGRFTDATAWYIYGGLAAAVGGFLMVVFGASGRAA